MRVNTGLICSARNTARGLPVTSTCISIVTRRAISPAMVAGRLRLSVSALSHGERPSYISDHLWRASPINGLIAISTPSACFTF
ncbi:MAG: hypothetical protein EHM33_01000 [Chloroflexi bacterium]|nr:MAG: hypothetical protein EHM33_01000 [Chloroflexota bacterium]